jgi:hypothetical protein
MTSAEEHYAAELHQREAARLQEHNKRVDEVNAGLQYVHSRVKEDYEFLVWGYQPAPPTWFLSNGRVVVGWEAKYPEYVETISTGCYFLSDGTLVKWGGNGYNTPETPVTNAVVVKFTRNSFDQHTQYLRGIHEWLRRNGAIVENTPPEPPAKKKKWGGLFG